MSFVSGLRHRLTPLALSALVAAPLGAVAQSEVTLNLVPLPKSAQQLDTNMTMRMNMDMKLPANATDAQRANAQQAKAAMPMTLTNSMRQRIETTAADASGAYTMKASSQSLKNEMRDATGNVKPVPSPGVMTFTAKVQGSKIEPVDFRMGEPANPPPGLTPEARAQMFRQMFEWMEKFNGTTFKVGESKEFPLDMQLPIGPNASKGRIIGRYTLRKVENGVASFDVGLRFDMNVDVSAQQKAAAASGAASAPTGPSKVAMTGNGTGQLDIRLADRVQLLSTIDMKMNMDMAAPDGSQVMMTMDMKVDSRGRSVPVGAAKPAGKAAPKG